MKTIEPKPTGNKWLNELVSPGTLITVVIVVAGIIGQWFTIGARLTSEERDTALLMKRQDDTDHKFERLPKDYVLRTELQDMLNSIREDERDIKLDLRTMRNPGIVLGR